MKASPAKRSASQERCAASAWPAPQASVRFSRLTVPTYRALNETRSFSGATMRQAAAFRIHP
jgi:hypothetical protein